MIFFGYVIQFCLHVCLNATGDKYTCTKLTGLSLDCARGGRIRAVIFHLYTQPSWVYLKGRSAWFYVCLQVSIVCLLSLHMFGLSTLGGVGRGGVSLSSALLIFHVFCNTCSAVAALLHLSCHLICLFSSHLSKQIKKEHLWNQIPQHLFCISICNKWNQLSLTFKLGRRQS